MKLIRLTFLAMALMLGGAHSAFAHSDVGFSISIGSPGLIYGPPAVYYAPPPVYYAPSPAYYYYEPRIYYRYYEPRHHHHHFHRGPPGHIKHHWRHH